MKIYKISFSFKQFNARPYEYSVKHNSYYLVAESHALLLHELATLEKHYSFDKDKYIDFVLESVSTVALDSDVKLLQK